MLAFSPLPTPTLTTTTSTSTTPAPGTCTSDGLRIWDAAGFWRRLKVGETCKTTSTQTITTRVPDSGTVLKVTEGQYATAPTPITTVPLPLSPIPLPPAPSPQQDQVPQEQPPAPGNGATTNEVPPGMSTGSGSEEVPPPPPPPPVVLPAPEIQVPLMTTVKALLQRYKLYIGIGLAAAAVVVLSRRR